MGPRKWSSTWWDRACTLGSRRGGLILDRRIVLTTPAVASRGASGITVTPGQGYPVFAGRDDSLGYQADKREGEGLYDTSRSNYFIFRTPTFEALTKKWRFEDEWGKEWKILAVKEWKGRVMWRLVVEENV